MHVYIYIYIHIHISISIEHVCFHANIHHLRQIFEQVKLLQIRKLPKSHGSCATTGRYQFQLSVALKGQMGVSINGGIPKWMAYKGSSI